MVDNGTYEQLVVPQLGYLLGRSLGMTRNREEAEDLLQETCLKAWRSFRRYRQGTNCRAWLVTILKNCFISRWRRSGGDDSRPTLVGLDNLPDLPVASRPSDPIDPHQALEVRREAEAAERLMSAIAPPFRATLRLYFQGMSYREIAAREGVPIGTVMSRLYRARRQAATLLRTGPPGAGRRRASAADSGRRAPAHPFHHLADGLQGSIDQIVGVRQGDEHRLELRWGEVDPPLQHAPEEGGVPLAVGG